MICLYLDVLLFDYLGCQVGIITVVNLNCAVTDWVSLRNADGHKMYIILALPLAFGTGCSAGASTTFRSKTKPKT